MFHSSPLIDHQPIAKLKFKLPETGFLIEIDRHGSLNPTTGVSHDINQYLYSFLLPISIRYVLWKILSQEPDQQVETTVQFIHAKPLLMMMMMMTCIRSNQVKRSSSQCIQSAINFIYHFSLINQPIDFVLQRLVPLFATATL